MRAATEIARFDADVQRARDAVRPLARQLVPSHEWPFVFFHLRKAGGSTVRTALDDAAKAAKVDSFVACQGGVSCTTWGPSTDHHDGKGPDVIGGHFFAPLVDRWASQRWSTGRHAAFLANSTTTNAPACFVLLRQTVPRVKSCWNYRFIQTMGQSLRHKLPGVRSFGNTSAAEIGRTLPRARSNYDEGCNNEAARVLSYHGFDEELLGRLTAGGESSATATAVVAEVLKRLSSCVVGILERCADTETVLRAYLPWLAPHYACENTTLNRGTVEDRKDAVVDADVEDVVLRQNALDEVAYKFGDEMLTLRLAQGQSYLKGAAAHKNGSPK